MPFFGVSYADFRSHNFFGVVPYASPFIIQSSGLMKRNSAEKEITIIVFSFMHSFEEKICEKVDK